MTDKESKRHFAHYCYIRLPPWNQGMPGKPEDLIYPLQLPGLLCMFLTQLPILDIFHISPYLHLHSQSVHWWGHLLPPKSFRLWPDLSVPASLGESICVHLNATQQIVMTKQYISSKDSKKNLSLTLLCRAPHHCRFVFKFALSLIRAPPPCFYIPLHYQHEAPQVS